MTRRLGDYFVPKEEIPARVYLAVSILAGVFVIGLWCLLTYAGLVRDDFLPPPHRVIATAGKLISDGSLLKHTLASVTVILVGFIISSLVAVPIGIISGSFRVVEAFVEPIVNFTRYLPVSALIPLLILWVGIGMEEKIAVIIIGTFFQQILMVSDVSAQVPKDLLDASYTLGASRRQVITRVLLPAVLPGVIDTLRVTMGLAWTYLVVAELVGAFQGLGYLIMSSMRGLATDIIFVAIITIGLLGLFFDQLFKLLRRLVVPLGDGALTMPSLGVEDVSLRFRLKGGREVVALDDVSLTVRDREFAVIVGPSGCGKSSLLRMVAGLQRPTAGKIRVDDRVVTAPGRDRGMVFQSYTLFPWLSVRKNVAFGPSLAGMPEAERMRIAAEFIRLVGLTGFEDAYPRQLSGGMMQRVALARALANDPEVLLMDEPFGALDSQTRSLMQELLLSVWEVSHKTVLFVTHDVDEAILLGDRVFVMTAQPGRIKAEIEIDLPRPRHVEAAFTSQRFIDFKREIHGLIRNEARKAIQL